MHMQRYACVLHLLSGLANNANFVADEIAPGRTIESFPM